MLFSYNWLQEYTAAKLPKPDKLADLLSLHAFEVETVDRRGKDWIIDISGKAFPNRPDAFGHIGLAREIAAIEGKKITLPKNKAVKAGKGSLKQLKVTVESSEFVPRYAGIVVEGVKIGKSPKKVQEYLQAVGVHSINSVVDLTNFIMLEMGQPLHAFDYDQIQGQRMNVRQAKEGEKLETLDEQILSLPKGALVIEDAERLIDLAGIKGGKGSGISADTKNIFLQAANFQAQAIYKTKKALKYTTQAADIYAHEIDPNLTMLALQRANYLLQEWGIGGKVVQVIDIYPKKALPRRMRLDLAYAESLLGISVSKARAKNILQTLECKVTDLPAGRQEKSGKLQVEVPTRRLDLQIPEDLVEEIGRIYGYENIPSMFPAASLIPPPKNVSLHWQEMVKNTLAGMGFTEVYTYSFQKAGDIELENPISQEFSYLRTSLLEKLPEVVQKNQKKYTSIRIFEIGSTFRKKGKRFEETAMLAGALYGENFYAAKGVVDSLLQSLGITGIWYAEAKSKGAEVKIGLSTTLGVNQSIGFVGAGAFQLNMEKLASLASEEVEYRPASKYPAVLRDIAVLVPSGTKVAEVMNGMNAVGQELIRDIDLFDIYEELEAGKKSLAFHIIYQSGERTLTGKEVDELHARIIQVVEQNPEWEVRK